MAAASAVALHATFPNAAGEWSETCRCELKISTERQNWLEIAPARCWRSMFCWAPAGWFSHWFGPQATL